MSLLPVVGTCSYNGFTIPVESDTQSLTAVPVQDMAKRTIVYVVYSIVLHWKSYVAAGSDMNATMDTMRKQLTAQGGTFYYEDKGLGNISVNVPGRTKKDVIWGPIPKMLKMRQIGINAVDVIWQIDVAIPECSAAAFNGRIMEFNFNLAFAIETSGYQRRTYSGFIRIPMTRSRQDDRRMPDNIDDYRYKIYPKLLPGFRRTPGTFKIDESKTRLDFTIEDTEEGPNFAPPGCVSATASHSYSNIDPRILSRYTGTIEAEYEILRGSPRHVAKFAFANLVAERAKFLADDLRAFAGPQDGKVFIFPMNWSASEPEIYGHLKCKYSLKYGILLHIRHFLASALWEPVADSNWSKWSKPLSEFAWTANGNAGLRFYQQDDAIIDLCLAPPSVGASIETTLRRTSANNNKDAMLKVFKPPTPDISWWHYENRLRLETISSNIIHQPLSTTRLTSTQSQNDFGFKSKDGFKPVPSLGPPSIIQERSGPMTFIIMEGSAVRIGFEIPEPRLARGFGGMFPYDMPGDGFKTWISGNIGWRIYTARWRKRYALPTPPKSLSPLPTPDGYDDTLGGLLTYVRR